MKHILLFLICAVILAGCSHTIDKLVNAPVDEQGELVPTQVIFDPKHNLSLDVYVPHEKSHGPRDVVIFFYGGSWENGARGFYRFVAQSLTQAGFIVVIPDYRKYPDVTYPDFLYDTAHAIAWTHANITNFGGNKSRIHLLGHSAGAYNAAMVAANPLYLERFGLAPHETIQSFAGLAGPYAFEPNTRKLKTIFATSQDDWARMQVPSYVTRTTPPMLLIHGGEDNLVGLFNSEKLFAALEKHHVPATLRIYRDLGHIGVMRAFSWLADGTQQSVKNDVIDFFKTH